MNYTELGRRVRALRKKRRWTQEELSQAADISLSFCGHIERGTRKASIETLVAIANALETSPDHLLYHDLTHPDGSAIDRDNLRKLHIATAMLQDTLAKLG